MTQGFPPGQQPPQGYGPAPPQYQQPQQPQQYQQPQAKAAYPAGGYPQPGAYGTARRPSGGSRGPLVALFLAALLPVVVDVILWLLFSIFEVRTDWFYYWLNGYWDFEAVSWMFFAVYQIYLVSVAGVLFGSKVFRWVVFGAALVQFLNGVVHMVTELLDGGLAVPVFDSLYLPVIIMALLPPIGRAFEGATEQAQSAARANIGYPNPYAPHQSLYQQ